MWRLLNLERMDLGAWKVLNLGGICYVIRLAYFIAVYISVSLSWSMSSDGLLVLDSRDMLRLSVLVIVVSLLSKSRGSLAEIDCERQ